MYDGDLLPALKSELLIASEDGYLLRVRPPDAGQSVPLMSERLLQDRVGPILLVAVGPDGRVYFSTPDSLGAVRPLPPAGVHGVTSGAPLPDVRRNSKEDSLCHEG